MTLSSPLVSCVLPFTNPSRLSLVRKAVNNFIFQRYTPYELLIVNGTGQSVLTNSDMDSEPYVAAGCLVKEIQADAGLNAAQMRNIALLEHAKGDYVICIDDDDYFHPDRLLHQMAHRPPTGTCLLKHQLRVDLTGVLFADSQATDLATNSAPKLHLLTKNEGIASTALFPRLDLLGNPWTFNEDLTSGEHVELVNSMRLNSAVSIFDNRHTPFNAGSNLPLLSVAMYHGGNELSYADFFEPTDAEPSSSLNPGDIEFLKTILRSYNFQVN
jgi:hypothetical protein